MPPRSSTPDQVVATALAAFLRRSKVRAVAFAENVATTPQPLAYLVHFPRLYVALRGEDTMWLEQDGQARLMRLRGGDAVVIPANCWNRPIGATPSLTLNVLFGRRQIGISLVEQSRRPATSATVAKATLHGALEDAPRSIMHALLALRAGSREAAPPLVEALLRAVLGALAAPPQAAQRRTSNLYESICMFVQEHFQFPLSRDSVAAHFRVSPNHVSRVFQQEGMVSFNAYVTYVRINRAKYLLKHHRQSIDEVAAMCGFSETSYFCRVFKQKTELTPSGYRQAPL